MAVLRRLLFLLLLPMVVYGQGARYDNFVMKPLVTGGLTPVSGALITVCISAAVGQPCAPKVANIYSDEALTVTISGTGGAGTTNSDANGNYGFYIAPGSYIITITGSGITSATSKVTMPCNVSNCTMSGPMVFSGGGTLGGNWLSSSTNLDLSSLVMKTWSDPNGGGPGSAANRQASVIVRGTSIASDASSAANHTLYLGGELDCHNSIAEECHFLIVYPVIKRGVAASIPDKLTGVSFAAPIAPAGDASTAKSNIAASVSVESNPPTSWCNSGGTDATALANLGVCSFSFNVSSGATGLRGPIDFYAAGTGINNGVGDLPIQNLDTTAAGTITFYNGGSNRFQIRNTGAASLSNALRIGDTAAPNTALDVVGTGRFSTGATPAAAAGADLGTAALPWANLWLGTAATNNFKFQPAATAAARTVTLNDPLGNVSLPFTIANGTSAMTTALIAAGACGTTVTTAATGTLATDTIDIAHNIAVTNANGGILTLNWWPTAGNVNFNYCNPTAAGVTPTAMTVNWSVRRP